MRSGFEPPPRTGKRRPSEGWDKNVVLGITNHFLQRLVRRLESATDHVERALLDFCFRIAVRFLFHIILK